MIEVFGPQIGPTNLWLFLKKHVFTLENLESIFSIHHYSLLLSTVMVHLNFSILNDKPSLFLPTFLCIGMYLAWVLGFFLEDLFLHWYKLESISKILCPRVLRRRIPFWWSEKVKKSSTMMKIEKSSRNHAILKTDFCKCKWRSYCEKFNLASFQF